MVPPLPADWARSPGIPNEKQIAIDAKMTRRIDVFMSYPPKSFDLVFDVVLDALSKNKVNRRGPGEERERRYGLSRGWSDKRLYGRYHRRDVVQCHRCLGQLHAYMCGGAKGAVRVGEVPLGMDVNNLNRPAGNNQRDAQQGEKKSPRAAHLRY